MEVPPIVQVLNNIHKNRQQNQKQQLWNNSESFLKSHNSSITRPPYNINFSREDCIIMARTRLGTTRFSTQHYYEQTQPMECEHCLQQLTIYHILKECPMTSTNDPLDEILNCNSKASLYKIKNILYTANVLYDI